MQCIVLAGSLQVQQAMLQRDVDLERRDWCCRLVERALTASREVSTCSRRTPERSRYWGERERERGKVLAALKGT